MLKKTITYTDYEGIERTEDFYFNLTKSELIKMEMMQAGGMKNKLEQIINSKNVSEIMKIFEDILLKAYGKKSDDGTRFIKSEELSKEFSQTIAYDQLFMELVSDDKAAAKFITSLVPSDIQKQVQDELSKQNIM